MSGLRTTLREQGLNVGVILDSVPEQTMQQLVLWESTELIRQLANLRSTPDAAGNVQSQVPDPVIRAMRTGLGQSNIRLNTEHWACSIIPVENNPLRLSGRHDPIHPKLLNNFNFMTGISMSGRLLGWSRLPCFKTYVLHHLV